MVGFHFCPLKWISSFIVIPCSSLGFWWRCWQDWPCCSFIWCELTQASLSSERKSREKTVPARMRRKKQANWPHDVQPLHPRKLTCPLKRDYFSREYIFQPLIFRGHVSFHGSNPWLRICFGRCTSGISWTHSPQLAFKCGFLSVVMDALVNEEPWGTVSWPLMPGLPHHALYWYKMSLWFSPLLWKEQWNWGNLCRWKFNSEKTIKNT